MIVPAIVTIIAVVIISFANGDDEDDIIRCDYYHSAIITTFIILWTFFTDIDKYLYSPKTLKLNINLFIKEGYLIDSNAIKRWNDILAINDKGPHGICVLWLLAAMAIHASE